MHVGEQRQREGLLGVTLAVSEIDGLLAHAMLAVVGVVVDGNVVDLRLYALASQRQHARSSRHTESLPVERNDVEVVGRMPA